MISGLKHNGWDCNVILISELHLKSNLFGVGGLKCDLYELIYINLKVVVVKHSDHFVGVHLVHKKINIIGLKIFGLIKYKTKIKAKKEAYVHALND